MVVRQKSGWVRPGRGSWWEGAGGGGVRGLGGRMGSGGERVGRRKGGEARGWCGVRVGRLAS